MDLISVIIPIYKAEKYLEECIESIIKQNYKNIEILLIDDESPDRCPIICDSYAQKDNRIKVYHKKNTGAHSSRIFGVQHCKGKYIAFVDADDKLPKNALAELYNAAQKYNLDIVLGSSLDIINNNEIRQNNNVVTNGIYSGIEYIKFLLCNKCIIGPACKIIKKSLFNNIQFELPKSIFQHEDLYMNILTGINCHKIGIFNNINAYYYSCLNQESLSRGKLMLEDNWIQLFYKIKEQLNNHALYKQCSKEYTHYIHKTIYSLFFIRALIPQHYYKIFFLST